MRKNCVLFFIVVMLIIPRVWAQSNEGTDFWLGFMEHLDQGNNTKVVMISSKFTTSGTVSIPLQNFTQNFQVNANDVTIINIPNSGETIGSEIRRNTGIRVQSEMPVSVYTHQYQTWRSEAAMILPVSSLGNEYYIMTYRGYERQGEIFPAEFLIVAQEDETQVSVTVSDRTLGGRNAGNTFSFTLDEGEAYQVQARNGNNGDLTGSRVVADKDIAVFGGNKWTQVPTGCNARDNLLEQMYPLSTWGKQFVTVPNKNVTYDIFRVLAAEDGTQVTVDKDDDVTFLLDAGEFEEFRILGEPSLITSNNPILIAQFNVGQDCNGYGIGDPSMLLLNSIEQTRDTVTLFNSRFQNITENFINIITRTVDAPGTTFDGQPVENFGGTFAPIGANGEFSFASLTVSAGSHTIINDGCGVIANAYGYGDAESYSYGGGANFIEINANPIPVGGCLNDTIFFDAGLPESKFLFAWDFGDGTTSTEPMPTHIYDRLGSYPVTLQIINRCLGTEENLSQSLLVTLRQAVDAGADIRVCEGDPFQLSATDLPGATYEWRGPLDYFSEEQFPIVDTTHPGLTGDFRVIGIISGCATFPATTPVEVIGTPQPDLGQDTVICPGDDIIPADPGTFSQYQWQNNSTDRVFTITEPGQYVVDVLDDFGCQGTDTLMIAEACPTRVFVPTAFSPNDDGRNDTFMGP